MLTDAILAWVHFVLAFLMVSVLVAEALILRLPVDGRVARLLARVDVFYGGSAGDSHSSSPSREGAERVLASLLAEELIQFDPTATGT